MIVASKDMFNPEGEKTKKAGAVRSRVGNREVWLFGAEHAFAELFSGRVSN